MTNLGGAFIFILVVLTWISFTVNGTERRTTIEEEVAKHAAVINGMTDYFSDLQARGILPVPKDKSKVKK